MDFLQVVKELRILGTEQNRALYRRHGATGEILGASLSDLDSLRKKIQRNHKLALQLWDLDIMEARCLATLIADPDRFTELELDAWVADINFFILADYFVSRLAVKSKYSKKLSLKWIKAKNEHVCRCGFSCATLLTKQNRYRPAELKTILAVIEESAVGASAHAREAMNSALLEISTIPAVRNAALKTSETIRKLESEVLIAEESHAEFK